MQPESPLPGRVSYFIGRDRARWRTGIPTYGRVRYSDLWPGIDAVFYGRQGRLEYDLVLRPGADAGQIGLSLSGAGSVRRLGDGSLLLGLGSSNVRQLAPHAYQMVGHRRRAVPSAFVLEGARLRLRLGAYDRRRTLVIDPTLSYATYLGGTNADYGQGVAVDASGAAYIVGHTPSTDFPTTMGAFQTANAGSEDVFVTKLSADGKSLAYSTYLGGSGFDGSNQDPGMGIAVDASGAAYVTGYVVSSDFPTTAGAFQTSLHGGTDAFVTKLAPDGKSLAYSTYLGGSGIETGYAIAVDTAGAAYVTGETNSTTFPTTAGADQTANGGSADAFITKLAPDGKSLAYSTYLGGTGNEEGFGIAVDASGVAYVTGMTEGNGANNNFPTTAGAFQTTFTGAAGFVTSIAADGKSLGYSTFLGGADGRNVGRAIAVDASGAAYVTGTTSATNFPTTAGAFQTANPCCHYRAFVTKLASDGKSLGYSTYLGGTALGAGAEYGFAIALDSAGSAYVAGETQSTDFPTTADAYQKTQSAGGDDAFVSQFASDGKSLLYSTYLGGSVGQRATGIALDSTGAFYVEGWTSSTDFPTTAGAYQTASGGNVDAFVAKFSPGSAGKRSTSTAISCSPNPVAVGRTTTCTATVVDTGAGTKSTPLGTVSFSSDSSGSFANPGTACTLNQVVVGKASCSLDYTPTAVNSGTHTITGTYSGSDIHQSSSGNLGLTVTKRATSTSVSCSPASVSVGQTTTCTATVSDVDGGPASTPTGTVTFSSDSSGSFTKASCTLDAGGSCHVDYTPTAVNSGTHRITGAYGGDATHAASNGAGNVTVTAPGKHSSSTAVSCSPSSVNVGQPSTCSATVTDTGAGPGTTPGGTVTFASDSQGVFTSPGTTCTLDANGSCHVDYSPSAVGSGTHQVTGSYNGDAGHTASSGGASVGVTTPPAGKRKTAMALFCTNDPINVGQPIGCSVEVRDTDAGTQTTPTGNISVGTDSNGSFSNPGGTCTLRERFVGSGDCTVTYTPGAVGTGTHTIAASYGGDSTHNATSSTTTLTVQPASAVDVIVTGIEVTQGVQTAGCGGCRGSLPSRDRFHLDAPGQADYQGVTMAARKYTMVRVFAHVFTNYGVFLHPGAFLPHAHELSPARASSGALESRGGVFGIPLVGRSYSPLSETTASLEVFDALGRRIAVLGPDTSPNSLKPSPCGVCVDLAERADPGTSFNFLVPWQDTYHRFVTFRATVTPPVGPGRPGQCAGCGGNTFTLSRVPFLNTIRVPIHPIPLKLLANSTTQSVSQVFGDSRTVLPNQLALYPYDAPLSVNGGALRAILGRSLTNDQAAAAVAQRASDDGLSSGDYPIGVFYKGEGSLANGLTTGQLYLGNGPASIVQDSGRSLTSVTHEIGHGLGLPHADTGSPLTYFVGFPPTSVTQYILPHPDGTPDCGGNSGGQSGEPWPPDNEGRLQSVGLDRRSWDFGQPASNLSTFVEGYEHSGISTGDLTNGARYYDFMSYCPAGGVFEKLDWISARNWSKLLAFHSLFGPPPLPPAADRSSFATADRSPFAAADPPVRVIATVEPNGTASIFDVAPGQQTTGGPTLGSPYQFELRDAAGNVLQSVVPTTTPIHQDGSPPGTLLVATLPFAPGTASVVLTSGGQVLATRVRSPHAPTVKLLSPRPGFRLGGSATLVRWRAQDTDGGPLVTTIDYSSDGGRHWKVVADGLTGTSARVPNRFLSRSSRGRLRLRVSDGFNVTTVVSGPLRARGAPPLVQILDARSGGRVRANATILLTAWAFDDAGRPLTGRSLKWFAGRKLLGRGEQLSANGLPLGTKAIRLVATDSYGRSSQAVLRLRVLAVPTAFLVWRAPASVSAHAWQLRIVVASTSSATFLIARRQYPVGTRPRAIVLRIRPGRSPLIYDCVLRSPGGVIRGTYVVLRGR